ncbi:MAG: hypothetical protein WC595_04935 [Candidatus Nanoarchaeia archaeon]
MTKKTLSTIVALALEACQIAPIDEKLPGCKISVDYSQNGDVCVYYPNVGLCDTNNNGVVDTILFSDNLDCGVSYTSDFRRASKLFDCKVGSAESESHYQDSYDEGLENVTAECIEE